MHFLQAINSDISVLIVCNKTGGTIKGDIKKRSNQVTTAHEYSSSSFLSLYLHLHWQHQALELLGMSVNTSMSFRADISETYFNKEPLYRLKASTLHPWRTPHYSTLSTPHYSTLSTPHYSTLSTPHYRTLSTPHYSTLSTPQNEAAFLIKHLN